MDFVLEITQFKFLPSVGLFFDLLSHVRCFMYGYNIQKLYKQKKNNNKKNICDLVNICISNVRA